MNEIKVIQEDLRSSLPQKDDGTVRVIGIAFSKKRPQKQNWIRKLWSELSAGATTVLERLGFSVQDPEQGILALQITEANSTTHEQLNVANCQMGSAINKTFGYIYPVRPESAYCITAYMMYVHISSPDRIRFKTTCSMWDTSEQSHIMTWAKITVALQRQGYLMQMKDPLQPPKDSHLQ